MLQVGRTDTRLMLHFEIFSFCVRMCVLQAYTMKRNLLIERKHGENAMRSRGDY